jgi:hypothetical protein
MKNKEKSQNLEEIAEYIEQGIEEMGRENKMNFEVTTIYKGQRGKMPDSIFVIQNFANELAKRKSYSANTFRVLMHFFGLSQFENFISIDIKTISENLDISEASVKRATSQLKEDNIIIKFVHPTDKRRIDYFLNPHAAWRGNTLNRDKQLKKHKDNKMQLDMFTL